MLISGGGTTLRNLLEQQALGMLPVEFALVISSNPTAGGLRYARDTETPELTFERKAFASGEAYSEAVFGEFRERGVGLVVMAGFLKHLPIPPDFENRVMNIHPALIPAFCGHGYYGQRVHQAVLDYGAKISGCTVHFVDNEFDHGPVILQRAVPVLDDDTAEVLAARVFTAECEAYPEAIRLFGEGRLRIEGRRLLVEA